MNTELSQLTIRKALRSSPIETPLSPDDIPEEVWTILQNMDPVIREHYFGDPGPSCEEIRSGELLADLLLKWCEGVRCNQILEEDIGECETFEGDYVSSIEATASQLLQMEQNAREVFRDHKNDFPLSIWSCCKRRCFASLAINPETKNTTFKELGTIHSAAEDLHEELKNSSTALEDRRKGIGGSSIAFTAPNKEERESQQGIIPGSNRKRVLHNFAAFVLEVLPFLYGQENAPNGVNCPPQKLCTNCICNLLGVSRNFLYFRKKKSTANKASDDKLSCIIDSAGIRLRQHRRKSDRTGYVPISDLSSYNCGCYQPCLRERHITWLQNEYKAFYAIARTLNPLQKENRYLLNVMYSPFMHSPVRICNRALSALYTVSKDRISDVRLVLQQMCDDPSLDHREFLAEGVSGYRKHQKHPMNRYPDHIREKIEKHLDMILRADPAGANERNICRVYSPEINTKEKLRRLLAKMLEEDDTVDGHPSESTLQRMTDKYLEDRKCNVVFTQNDHNACLHCKTMNYAILEYYHQSKEMEARYENDFSSITDNADPTVVEAAARLKEEIEAKRYQEQLTLEDLKSHLARDAAIRKVIKEWSDFFRKTERDYLDAWRQGEDDGLGIWNGLRHHGIVTHQDDMTKVDLPHFLVTVSSDISRWRFDINAHVSAVNDDCVVFSHEQGTSSKTASFISEMILLDHLVRCRGESIKIVVSDNAAVGKNWITTMALPQYIIDQGLAEIVFIVYLENNHGKWLADMLFGQLQTRKRRSTLLSIDDLLSEFEAINRKSGRIRGLAVNPLASIDFSTIFESLGYKTSPPKDFGFNKRNIHFAAACTQDAKRRLHTQLKKLFGHGLPDNEGMVRISSSPPSTSPQDELPYEERYFDVPAARVSNSLLDRIVAEQISDVTSDGVSHRDSDAKPLAIPMDKEFSAAGNCVVSQNVVRRVGYNGYEFRKQNGTPELRQLTSRLVRQAWPIGLLKSSNSENDSGEPVYGSEIVKCAPENWVIREPVSHFSVSEKDCKARYPPRNMMNAKYCMGPRAGSPYPGVQWVPTRTYQEPPFPFFKNSAAKIAMEKLAQEHQDPSKPVDVLDVLRAVFSCMENRTGVSDQWLHRRATVPNCEAIDKYRKELEIFIERGKGAPKPPKTLRQFFKNDPEIIGRVERLVARGDNGKAVKGAKQKLFSKLFDELENSPGGLDRYSYLLEKDQERYAKELHVYQEKLLQFDRERGLMAKEV